MQIDENEFFRQTASRICSSLDIEKATADCLSYIMKYIPASEIMLNQIETESGMIRFLACVTASGEKKSLPSLRLPDEILQEIKSREWQEVKIDNNPNKDILTKFILPYHKVSDPSVMVMGLAVEGKRLGLLTILAEGKGCFSEIHSRLFSLLSEPFAIAMSNALRYEEVLKLKEMVDAENRELSRELLNSTSNEIIGADFGLAGVMEMVRQVAPLKSQVMLLGETGVGKEVIANAIHNFSPRRNAPFVKVNCGALPESLLDSELFGHEKGAFTGAIMQKRGRFERANKGSIFLDEIAELPLQAQARLLRVLQHKEIERVGGTQTIPVDVRIIMATNRDLKKMVHEGHFREDLWYRINIFPIMIPPLRQHAEDIPSLVYHFIEKKSKELKIHTPPSISVAELERLKAYTWPGNVRELENLIERQLILKRRADDSDYLIPGGLAPSMDTEMLEALPIAGQCSLPLDEVMSQYILHVLKLTKGKIQGEGGAAQILRIKPSTLRSRMKKLGIPFSKK